MIEAVFSILLGFAIISSLCGLMPDNSKGDRILMRTIASVVILCCLTPLGGGEAMSFRRTILYLITESVTSALPFFILGGMAALCLQLNDEGYLQRAWIKLHPQSAPTPEAKRGQRAQVNGFQKKHVPATLVGTSTNYLNEELDLRTETLIRLSYSVFEDRGALTMSRLESALRLGTGRRQKAFHKIVAGHHGRPNTKRIVHRYWRSVNGSSRLSQGLFGELCKLAQETNNRDRATISRLSAVGVSLGLTPEEMGRAIHGSL